MSAAKKKIRTRKGLRDQTYLGCPLTRNRSAWCYRLCVPNNDGHGQCGRVAPHSLQGEVGRSIERHKERKKILASHCARLERSYLADPCNVPYKPGVRVAEREAEVVVPLQDMTATSDGNLYGSVSLKLLSDAAALAVNSIVTEAIVVPANFNVHFTRTKASGSLTARGRLLAVSTEQYLAESVVVDSEGAEIGRGTGAFVRSGVALREDRGGKKGSA